MIILEQGGGQVERQNGEVRLWRPTATHYANAQIHDYGETVLPYEAPVTLRLEAAFSHSLFELKGTAGFGFWNAPFAPGQARVRFPKAAWFFFGSPPLDLPLALGVPGSGFKAATIDATHAPFFALLPTTPLAVFMMRVPWLYRTLWPIGQRAIKVSEKMIDFDVTQRHRYELLWEPTRVVFKIDGAIWHNSPHSPTGRMGFVAWIDNQYAIATPQGHFGWGIVPDAPEQSLQLWNLTLNDIGIPAR